MVGGILMMGFMMTYASVTGAGLTMPLRALGAFVYGVESLIVGPTREVKNGLTITPSHG